MTTQEVADRFQELALIGQWEKIVDELYADDVISIEPENQSNLPTVKGLEAVKQKADMFHQMIEAMHGAYSTPPVVAGNFFTCTMGMDITMKGVGRINLDEVAVYEVRDGKIVREQFFF